MTLIKKNKNRICIAQQKPPLAPVLLKLIHCCERKILLKSLREAKEVRSFLVDRLEIVRDNLRPIQKTM
jgi:hypothetical protein